jgi:hypothetical protein
MTNKSRKQILGVVQFSRDDEKKNRWTRIGVAFENSDGSWNLRGRTHRARRSEGSERRVRAPTPVAKHGSRRATRSLTDRKPLKGVAWALQALTLLAVFGADRKP